MNERLQHDADIQAFRPLTVEQVYYLFRFLRLNHAKPAILDRLDGTDGENLWRQLTFYINCNCSTLDIEPLSVDRLQDILTREHVPSLDEGNAAFKYSLWAQFLPDPWYVFMNYGYRVWDEAENALLELTDTESLWRDAARMYERVACVSLDGRRVLEVGCGRGGGAARLARLRQPSQYVGLDVTASNIMFCRDVHRVDNLSFVHGRAETLPFEANSFDVLINVESCFYYDFQRFVTEAHRVLAPGGDFLVATLAPRARLVSQLDAIASAGFELSEQQDMTSGVLFALASLDLGHLLSSMPTTRPKQMYYEALTDIYRVPHLQNGSAMYVRWAFKRR